MTAATLVSRFEGVPAFDIVKLTVTDGYTYVSKLSNVYAAWATCSSGTSAIQNISISGRTLTITSSGLSGIEVQIICVGQL